LKKTIILFPELIKLFHFNIFLFQVPYAMSSLHISESLEKVCEGIDEYVRAIDKKTGELLLLRLILESGTMNPKMSDVDVVQDGDLNKSLKYYVSRASYEGNFFLFLNLIIIFFIHVSV